MKYLFIILAAGGLCMMLVPAILMYLDRMDPVQMKNYMLIGTLLWFSGAIPWLGKKREQN
jgi:Na+/H+ antiporter NhaA